MGAAASVPQYDSFKDAQVAAPYKFEEIELSKKASAEEHREVHDWMIQNIHGHKGEIVTINVGHCGLRLGNEFFGLIAKEHGLDASCNTANTEGLQAYFREAKDGKFHPRAVLADLDGTSIIEPSGIMATEIHKLLFPDRKEKGWSKKDPDKERIIPATDKVVYGNSSTNCSFAKGYYTAGAELLDSVLDCIRKEAESCNNLAGFQLTHALGGGTGSGWGSLIVEKIKDEYKSKVVATYSVLPAAEESTLSEPYNALFALCRLHKTADFSVIFDNQAVARMDIEARNATFARAMSAVTTTLRFPSTLNWSLRSIQGKMCLPGHLNHKFLTAALASGPDATVKIFDPASLLISAPRPLSAPSATEVPTYSKNEDCFRKGMLTAGLSADRYDADMKEVVARVTAMARPPLSPPAAGVTFARALFCRGVSAADVAAPLAGLAAQHMATSGWHDPNSPPAVSYTDPLPGAVEEGATCAMLVNTTAMRQPLHRTWGTDIEFDTLGAPKRTLTHGFQSLFRRKAFFHNYCPIMDEMEFTVAENEMHDICMQYHSHEVEYSKMHQSKAQAGAKPAAKTKAGSKR